MLTCCVRTLTLLAVVLCHRPSSVPSPSLLTMRESAEQLDPVGLMRLGDQWWRGRDGLSGRPIKSPYEFGPSGQRTHRWLKIARGTSERTIAMSIVSNTASEVWAMVMPLR